MNKAVFLTPFQNLHSFLIGNIMAFVGLTAVICKITDSDTPTVIIVSAAVTEHFSGCTAAASSYTDVTFVFFQPVGKVL